MRLRAPANRPSAAGAPFSSRRAGGSRVVRAQAQKQPRSAIKEALDELSGLGDTLGPIGLSYGGDVKENAGQASRASSGDSASTSAGAARALADSAGVSLGPISLAYGDDFAEGGDGHVGVAHEPGERPPSISKMTTEEWRAQYEKDGYVDLWLEDEFNAGSRLIGGRAVHNGSTYGLGTGEGPSLGNVETHKVTIRNTRFGADEVIHVDVPEDRYVLWEAEEQGLTLPWACRMGCCTQCAVRVVEGELYQPEALGISTELRERGFALMCVGFPRSDLVLETVSEDELYDLQFGRYFQRNALDPDGDWVLRDDFALEIAQMDE